MKRATILFVLLAAVVSFGRTDSDEDIAHALQLALEQRDHPRDRDSVQVSSVVITDKGICIDYRSPNEYGVMQEGFAVYRTDSKLVYLDNSWVWDKACVSGRYRQRREGRNITQAVKAALQPHSAANRLVVASVEPAAAAQPVVPIATRVAPQAVNPPTPVAIAAPTPLTAAPAARPVATAAPAKVRVRKASARAAVAVPVVAPPIQPAESSTAEVAVSKLAAPSRTAQTSPEPAVAPVAQPVAEEIAAAERVSSPTVVVTAAPVSAPAVTSAALAPAPAAPAQVAAAGPAQSAPSPIVRVAAVTVIPVETGTIRGATIIDNNGALGGPTPGAAAPVVEESLGDAARRLRRGSQH